jgi:hydrogenase maturation protein HypF
MGERKRFRISCRGAVQGVGFRPAVYRLAVSLRLSGWIRNGPEGVAIEVEGEAEAARAFVERLPESLPPLARLDEMDSMEISPTGDSRFEVRFSERGRRERALVPPDAALCADCRAEMEDPADRRHRYPFTTCTNCGPRFSLVRALPYDRERTSMSCFPLCSRCREEYEDPGDRRFHAEPVCCPSCGPRLRVTDAAGTVIAEGAAALEEARAELARGSIVALKGLGGFQLACRADDAAAVARLRERKRRPTKPFAVMVRDPETAARLADLGAEARLLLESPASPCVLAPSRGSRGETVAALAAPGLGDLGVMLPTTPLHVEIFRTAAYDALVMTSGNAGDEPICRRNREALRRLGGIADRFLLHDRDVLRRVDDSVVRDAWPVPVLVRRSRGFVPDPLPLPCETPIPVLAAGPHLQATTCLATGSEAFLSQHVGDLDTDAARAFLAEVAAGLEEFLEVRAGVIVVDAHPDYASTLFGERLASERGGRLLRVQHHLAHAAAVLAEHAAFPAPSERVAAIALDGTGLGADGTAWGGEWLLLDGSLRWRRLAHLEPLPLVGGEAAVREPWRVVVAALVREDEGSLLPRLPVGRLVPKDTLESVRDLAVQPAGWPLASGAGRVFEAAGALLGLATENGYEGEAAARLEALASGAKRPSRPWKEVTLRDGADGSMLLPGGALLAAAARRTVRGEDPRIVASGFHATFCRLAVELTERCVPDGVRKVAIGGGCLVNRLVRAWLEEGLEEAGFEPLFPVRTPPGDGGVAYGQAVVGAVAESRAVVPAEG